jgi:hypothetical protein
MPRISYHTLHCDCGMPVKIVSDKVVSVLCWRCVHKLNAKSTTASAPKLEELPPKTALTKPIKITKAALRAAEKVVPQPVSKAIDPDDL